ncbi:MAG: DNA-directed RNA polymerase subunit beta [Armatimonadota bacterium]|nr:DNA-directed RNA polymerase subunit beta [Armatimonadota bacterium]
MKEIQHKAKRTPEVIGIPNLVEIQLDSYRWFLTEGLRELFHSFSPIYDFTGNLSLEFLDYSLGEPKYTVEECRDRDMTFEAPIKVKVRLSATGREVIESEVYLGDLPLMTEKGTFVINGAERVVVSQLARSSGVYFKDTLDFSGRVLYFATIIPSEGAWVDIETDANDQIMMRVGQTRKFPLTTLLRALNMFPGACPGSESVPYEEAEGRKLAAPIVNKETGEIIADAKKSLTPALVKKLSEMGYQGKVEVEAASTPSDTTGDIVGLFSRKKVLESPTRDELKGRRLPEDVVDPKNGKVIVKAYAKITDEAARKIENFKQPSIEVLDINRYVEATLDVDSAHTKEEALLDIYHKIRPGDPATPESARSLLSSIFFDTRRYDLAKVGRYKLNKKLGLRLPETNKTITKEDLIGVIAYIVGLSESGGIAERVWADRKKKRLPEIQKAAKAEIARLDQTIEKEEDEEKRKPFRQRRIEIEQAVGTLAEAKTRMVVTGNALRGARYVRDLLRINGNFIATSPADETDDTIVRISLCDVDDIDHLENKRVRSVGELLQSQLRMGFLRMEKVAKERMTSLDTESVIPQVILSVKPISASIKSFFGSSQLSQFMDQTNPLAELTHKRRLSALGPGGLSRQSAKLEVRDVHHSHYGRICPIETPEGPNIGLIGSMAVHARIDEYGFLRTPYRVVKGGKLTGEIRFLSADEEEGEYLAPANVALDEKTGKLLGETVQVRYSGLHEQAYPRVPPARVTYMDVSPMQIMSAATAMIPFLENDDANRALMGSNMQRQSVPLLRADAPLVKTGIERKAARDSGAVIVAKRDGVARSVTAERIVIENADGTMDEYNLLNMLRSNQATCITQRPIVKSGQRVRAGDVIADGPCTQNGELALGQNILVAFAPWHGYNYEDAVLLSERLVKDDIFTSIHIEKYETEARDTKLGPEEITRDIPNIGEDMLKDLDENGIVRVGAEVRPEDILVGKVAPKGQGELTAEERLIIAIFGKKAEETRDVSLRVPHGEQGKVVDVKVFSRFKYKCTRCQAIFNYSKRPERAMCERCDGELSREPGDELPAGVNQLVRVYIAQKRKVMEGDKMAGRHGNKGVISKILPEEDMPFLADGTPVDMVLNPLGVPSRMNIGQILETHLGLVARDFGVSFRNPIFQGATEPEILKDLEALAWKMLIGVLQNYAKTELRVDLDFEEARKVRKLVDACLARLQEAADHDTLEAAVQPLRDAYNSMLERLRQTIASMSANDVELIAGRLAAPPAVDDPESFWQARREVLEAAAQKEAEESESEDGSDPVAEAAPAETQEFVPLPKDYDLNDVMARIDANVRQRVALELKYDQSDQEWKYSGKCVLYDGQTGERFDQPATVGYIYMMKLAHLVEDKIHARSTGPYSLVTQQPLGGKAQFGGQRFGEMEVWALEAYGAAYTLQEILTIKSDDVLGRVRTYESIVKGDSMLEPGVPESFKILVNEMQSLGLKVTVEDERARAIDLKDVEEELAEGDEAGRISARRRKRAIETFREDT